MFERIERPPAAPRRADRRPVTADEQALIAAALEAGRVTSCPTLHAAGLSALEQQFHAAPAPRPDGGKSWGS